MLAGAAARRGSRDGGHPAGGPRGAARAWRRSAERPRLHRLPEVRHGSLPADRAGGAAGRGGGRLAVQPSSFAWFVFAPRADPHGCQLERRVAGASRLVESQRLPYKGWSEVQLALERRFSGRVLPARIAAVARWRDALP